MMDTAKSISNFVTIAIDLRDKYSFFCALDQEGSITEEGRCRTTPDSFHQVFGCRPRSRIAIEVGTQSLWVSEVLRDCRHEVLTANPRRLRLIYQNNAKCDRADAEYLARIARMDPKLLSPIQHREKDRHNDLIKLRSRDALVTARTRLVNHVRGIVKPFGIRIPQCSTVCFPQRAQEALSEELLISLNPVLETLRELPSRIRAIDKEIRALNKEKYPETRKLEQVCGVGPLTAFSYVLTIGDPRCFKSSRALGAYLGLNPRRKESGESSPQLRITKAGNRSLRALLVSCA